MKSGGRMTQMLRNTLDRAFDVEVWANVGRGTQKPTDENLLLAQLLQKEDKEVEKGAAGCVLSNHHAAAARTSAAKNVL